MVARRPAGVRPVPARPARTHWRVRSGLAVLALAGSVLIGVAAGGLAAHLRAARLPTVSVTQPVPVSDGYRLPASAVVEQGGEQVVFVLVGDEVFSDPVSVTEPGGDAVTVTQGLKPGVQVVAAPTHLRDGERVRVG